MKDPDWCRAQNTALHHAAVIGFQVASRHDILEPWHCSGTEGACGLPPGWGERWPAPLRDKKGISER